MGDGNHRHRDCGLRRCTETDLSIVRPNFSGDVADPYVRPSSSYFAAEETWIIGAPSSGSSVDQTEPAS
jgi:hypothetical protein